MPAINEQADAFYDLQSLNRLKQKARKNESQALGEVARQFESIFLKMMMKSMRDANLGDPLFGNDNMKFYQDMYDQQLAVNLSQQRSVGLADMMVKQLQQPTIENPGNTNKVFAMRTKNSGLQVNQQQTFPITQDILTKRRFHGTVSVKQPAGAIGQFEIRDIKTEKNSQPTYMKQIDLSSGKPGLFVKTLWPYANQAARRLGVDPEVLLAQAGLETGWGKSIVFNENGENSHNLFNIKADHRWDGGTASKNTTEYHRGRPFQIKASFRAYESYAQSFHDYVKFLQQSPRYVNALKHAKSAARFVGELQKAGYATDPSYASKIERILRSDYFSEPVAKLKKNLLQPLKDLGG
ncbi:MAG: flagellar assembly peptidoglycan hydrolase FlgJ [Gammaproteobacteria bacterium]|nr:flagellar assembly peptidoglycan hydrolase FlgJ [Gammaproteobacteria bacterium]MDH5728286.1 flagellar assembly peptidoglycan hydrolase FlgJ [Gammaproteobacteria bacterium]